jgi:hypothetical protein
MNVCEEKSNWYHQLGVALCLLSLRVNAMYECYSFFEACP